MGVAMIANKMHNLCHLLATPLDSKHTEVSFSPNSNDLFHHYTMEVKWMQLTVKVVPDFWGMLIKNVPNF